MLLNIPASARVGHRTDATACSQLDCHDGLQSRFSDRKRSADVPLLRPNREPAEAQLQCRRTKLAERWRIVL